MATHELRTWPAPFAALLDGSKRHEVRQNDRNFKVGDILWLREWDPDSPAQHPEEQYTGRDLWAKVTYITTPGTWGMPPDICVMSVEIKLSHNRVDSVDHPVDRGPRPWPDSGSGSKTENRTQSQSMAAVRLCECSHTLTLHRNGGLCTFCECPRYKPKGP